jgi:hypothetical protein
VEVAKKRMFSSDITQSGDFLDLPLTSQALYFHLGMNADDDGFVAPRFIMKMIGSADDDLKILLAKTFLIPFEDRVVVVTHWKINNYIQSDRYQPTQYQNYKSQLNSDVSKMYTKCIPISKRVREKEREGTNNIKNKKFLIEQGFNKYLDDKGKNVQ